MGGPHAHDTNICIFDHLECRGRDRSQYRHISAARCQTVLRDPYGDLGAFQPHISRSRN